ncbi:MAG: PrsW family intramembrane metalloprotease [Verrucomicrobia bacterium]|nr:PrsW family intramembrane metalloprotease [Verrucomicrobiota bacterium]
MRYFYDDAKLGRVGPYTDEELRQLHLNGTVKPDSMISPEGGGTAMAFHEFWAKRPATAGGTWSSVEDFTTKAREDLKALVPHLLVPWSEFKSFRWLENRQFLAIVGIGLFPLLILAMFGDRGEIKSAYWALALYFSALWAVFFYYIFPAERVTMQRALICFFGTGLISIAVLLAAYKIPPLSWIDEWTRSREFALFVIWRKADPHPPQTMLFYGLICGLGFGIYEGVDYQMGRNLRYSHGIGEYYLLNVLRLTSLPFLHAVWTGIAAYFISFGLRYPKRKRGLFIVAIGLPALLHGTYDAATSTLVSFVIALFSVLALTLYLAKTVDFEKAVAEHKAAGEPPPQP